MASPQKENGYTAIANELLEAICRYQFPPKASVPPRIILFLLRKTYGYHKKDDVISLTQFQKGIGEGNRSNVVYWINYLVQAKILVKTSLSKMQVKYGLNKDYEQWLPLVQVKRLVQVRSWGSASNGTETSARKRTHKRNKENTKETVASDEVFDFNKEIQILREGKRKDFKIIALYWRKKGWVFENREQFNSALKRELRAAKALKGYTGEQIAQAIAYCEREYEVWTLESCHKRITDLINKK